MANALRLDVTRFTEPRLAQSLWQLANTLVPVALLWWLMAETTHLSWALTWALALPAAAFRLRAMLIQHDCGHGSFFKRHALNELLGAVLSVPSWAPFHYWRRTHAMHHVNSSRLEGRDELGSINTFTVDEYLKLSKPQQLGVRVYRNPLFLCGFGGPFQFLVKHRFPWDTPRTWKAEWLAVLYTNVGLLVAGALLSNFWGLSTVLRVELPIICLASAAAVWLIYIQHVYPDGHFASGPGWSHETASLHGSSFYRLPALLNWFTLNVGYHHVHHYAPKIPNYRLADAMGAHPAFAEVPELTFSGGLATWSLKLWDEQQRRFVGFPEATASSSAPLPSPAAAPAE